MSLHRLPALKDHRGLATLEALRRLIACKAPQLAEHIHYKMLVYGDHRGVALHLNAQKQYVSLYVGDLSRYDPDGDLLAGLDTGKSCIRFHKSTLMANTAIDRLLERVVAQWQQQGNPGGC